MMTGSVQKFGPHNRKAAKLTATKVEQMRLWYGQGMTQRELGARFGMSVGQVGRIVRGESWADTGAARGFVMQEEWEGVGTGGEVEKPGELPVGFAETDRMLAEASLREVRRRVEMGENPFEGGGVGGLEKTSVPEDVKQRAMRLLGQGSGEPEEVGPVGVDELPG